MNNVLYLNKDCKCKNWRKKCNTLTILTCEQNNKVVDHFQYNDKSNLLVIDPEYNYLGINLHDIIGEQPLHMLIYSNYVKNKILQCVRRIHRISVKSDSYVKFVYENQKEKDIVEKVIEINEKDR